MESGEGIESSRSSHSRREARHVESGEGIESIFSSFLIGRLFTCSWNPVKELKADIGLESWRADMVESGEGIERLMTDCTYKFVGLQVESGEGIESFVKPHRGHG